MIVLGVKVTVGGRDDGPGQMGNSHGPSALPLDVHLEKLQIVPFLSLKKNFLHQSLVANTRDIELFLQIIPFIPNKKF